MEKININELTKEEKLILFKYNNDIYEIVYNYNELYKYFDSPREEFLKFLNLLNKSTNKEFWININMSCGNIKRKLPRQFIKDFYYKIFHDEIESVAYRPSLNLMEYYKECLNNRQEELNKKPLIEDDNEIDSFDLILISFIVINIIFILLF